jgi:hypothetical protein
MSSLWEINRRLVNVYNQRFGTSVCPIIRVENELTGSLYRDYIGKTDMGKRTNRKACNFRISTTLPSL